VGNRKGMKMMRQKKSALTRATDLWPSRRKKTPLMQATDYASKHPAQVASAAAAALGVVGAAVGAARGGMRAVRAKRAERDAFAEVPPRIPVAG